MELKLQRRGSALLIVLVVVTLLVMMLGAFVGIHRSSSALSGNELQKNAADQTAMSALHYAWFRLELDKSWGVSEFSDPSTVLNYPPSGPPKLEITEDKDSVSGVVIESGSTFTLWLDNNLEGRTPVGSPPEVVPARSARVRVEARSGRVTRRLTAILRTQPLANSAALADKDIMMDVAGVGAWFIDSRDPYVKNVHSNTDIYAPSALTGTTKFRVPPYNGKASAVSEIILGGRDLSTDPTYRASSEAAADGRFQPGAQVVEVKTLSQDQLDLPTTVVPLAAGNYRFLSVEYQEWVGRPIVVGQDGDGNDILEERYGIKHTYYNSLSTPSKTFIGGVTAISEDPITPSSPSSPGTDGYQGVSGPVVNEGPNPTIAEAGGKQIKTHIGEHSITIPEGAVAQVDGPFNLSGMNPSLLLAEKELAGIPDNLANAGDKLDNPGRYSAALTGRSVRIDGGSIYGFGSISASGDIELNARSQLWAAPDLGVAIRGNNVHFEPPAAGGKKLLPNQALGSDWGVFKEALDDYDRWSQIDDWLGLPDDQKNDHSANLGGADISGTASGHWAAMKAAFALDNLAPPFPDPALGGGPITLDGYVRLREYAKNARREWNPEAADPLQTVDQTWLGGGHDQDIKRLIKNQVTHYATLSDDSLEEYFSASEMPATQDLFVTGLVYTDGDLTVNAGMNGLYFEGALVSHGRVEINGADTVDTVYNRTYLDDLLNLYPGNTTRLDQVFLLIR